MSTPSDPMTPGEASVEGAADEQRPRLSAVQRLWMVFTSPGEVFADIRIKPTIVVILLLLVGLGVVANLMIAPHVDMELTLRERLGERADQIDQEQMDRMVEQGEKWSKIGPIAAVVVGPVVWAVIAGVFFVMLKLVGSDADYPRALSTAMHAYWPPTVVQLALAAILVQRVGKIPQQEAGSIVKGNLGVLLSQDAPAWLHAGASTVSVFNVWAVILLVIGLGAAGRVSRGRAMAAALVPWGVWLAAKMALTAVFS